MQPLNPIDRFRESYLISRAVIINITSDKAKELVMAFIRKDIRFANLAFKQHFPAADQYGVRLYRPKP